MHRSGTSALTRVLDLHGVPLGSELLEAAADNQTGFWENRLVVDFHERLLGKLDSSWDDPRELPSGWLDRAVSESCLDELVSLLESEFGHADIWAVKDPRLCRMLPLWRMALERLRIAPKLVFCVRDPGEVVGSLRQRNGMSAATGALLWLRHLVEPVQASLDLPHCVVSYRELLNDWRGCMARVASNLDISWPVSSSTCAAAVDGHLRGDLRHQHEASAREFLPALWRDLLLGIHAEALAVAEGKAEWGAFSESLRKAMEQFAFTAPLVADLQPASIRERLNEQLAEANCAKAAYQAEASRLFDESKAVQRQAMDLESGRALAERAQQEAERRQREVESALEAAHSDRIRMQGEIIKGNARISVLEQAKNELEQLKASRSWRWTRPLRFALRTLRHRGLSPEDRRRLGWLPQPARGIVSSGMPHANPTTASAHGLKAQSTEGIRQIAPDALLAPQSPGKRDFFVWAVIDWHFRIQRPQHLARELAAAGHRVFYISNHFIDRAAPGFSVEALDAEGRLFQVHLHLAGSPAIYEAAPDETQREQLRAGIGELLTWTRSRACVSLVQHPYWLETAQLLPNRCTVYDCMDHHGGFADNTQEVLAREHELMRNADLLVVTSDWLQAETAKYNPRSLMVRNACQYEHFCEPPDDVFRDPRGRRVIGYYGAIAEWFDLDLLEEAARRHPDCLVLLVGGDTAGAQQRLRHLDNVEFTGEVAYAKLPYYLYGFDVCLLPFQVIPLTLATNPVKVYEYLSAGKPVVSIDLPEIRQFGDLVRSGADHDAFLAALAATLGAPSDAQEIARRKAFAAEQTWAHRVNDLVGGVDALPQPKVSVVVVTYNNLELTKVCLESVERYSDYPNLELIVVDNASADETPAYLQAWQRAGSHRHIILNADNRGFAAANNQGLTAATGDYLVMLNNDTHVTPGWVGTLVGHMRRSEALGMLGPVTNNIGNEARIDIRYANMEQMLQVSGEYTARHAGQLTPLHTAAFFCAMMPRHVYEKVGDLDEAFGIGMFEDDDYCRRIQEQGWDIACAEDVFIHHHLSASFSQIKQEKRQAMFEANKAIYEAKWGTWMPHKYRDHPGA
jgi:GT2 family glycosyltransferase/glycosyltransferase involved in cell wall biosynthesis